MDTKSTWQVFAAVLGALVLFGVLVLGYQAVSGPSAEECELQQMMSAVSQDSGMGETAVDKYC